MESHDRHFITAALKHAGNLAAILAIAVCVDVTLRNLVGKGWIDPTSFPYRCIKTVATIIEFCDSFLLGCIVIRETWDELVDLVRSPTSLAQLFATSFLKKPCQAVAQSFQLDYLHFMYASILIAYILSSYLSSGA